jgi:hypothetical protein
MKNFFFPKNRTKWINLSYYIRILVLRFLTLLIVKVYSLKIQRKIAFIFIQQVIKTTTKHGKQKQKLKYLHYVSLVLFFFQAEVFIYERILSNHTVL